MKLSTIKREHPRAISMKQFLIEQSELLGIRPRSVHMRIMRGNLKVKKLCVNARVVYVENLNAGL